MSQVISSGIRRHSWALRLFLFLAVLGSVEFAAFVVVKLGILQPAPEFTDAELAKLYPGATIDDARGIVRETWATMQFQYKPFVEYVVKPHLGTFIRVHPEGYRAQDPLPWPPPEGSVFLLGGSTAFGAGERDNHTIGQYLAQALGRPVYNFAVPAYYSTPERVRFFNLMTEGLTPKTAVFVDGINDFIFFDTPDRSNASNKLEMAFDINSRYIAARLISQLNFIKVFAFATKQPQDFLQRKAIGDRAAIERAANRLIRNREILAAYCQSKNIQCAFITQPAPAVDYDNSQRPVRPRGNFVGAENCIEGYRLLKDHYARSPMPEHLDLRSLRSAEPVYVDDFHYSAAMNKAIAEAIAAHLTAAPAQVPPAPAR